MTSAIADALYSAVAGLDVPDIFLSYNREDQAIARRFADAFQAHGLDVWWDTALRSGEAYDEVTEAALRGAKAVVVLWSKRSVASRWVRAEATLADRNRTLVPAMIEPCERPIMFELTQTAELSHWNGDPDDKAWRAYMDDVMGFVQRDGTQEKVSRPINAKALPPEKRSQPGEAPSLAVLPFSNRSKLPEDDTFAEGLVEDVISALARSINVRVLGAVATAHLRKAAITDFAAVGLQLGVRYLLEGNICRSGDKLRVTIQLLEVASVAVLWSAKFDRALNELAALHDDLVLEVAANLDVQIQSCEMQRALNKPQGGTAWEAGMRSLSAYRKTEIESMQLAVEEATRAVEMAPDFGAAHGMLALAMSVLYINAQPDNADEIERIQAAANRALCLAPDDASVLSLAGCAFCFSGDPHEGLRHITRSMQKAPSGIAHHAFGVACCMLNRTTEALNHFESAIRHLPGSHLLSGVHAWRANALIRKELWEEAEATIDQSLNLDPGVIGAYVSKAILCRKSGKEKQAKRWFASAHKDHWTLTQIETMFSRYYVDSPVIDGLLTDIRSLWEETAPPQG